MKSYIFIICLSAIAFMACSSKKEETDKEEKVETALHDLPNEVTVVTLKKKIFNHELISNGKISAHDGADLYFRTSEIVANVWVKNGDFVHKGQKIAELDLFKLNNALIQHKNSLAQANLEMQDILIGQGYAPDNIKAVPNDVLELAKIKSGYEQTKAIYESSLYDMEQATLIAPFDGIIANLFEKKYNLAKTSEPFCRVINTSNMEVDFTILEYELPLLKVGDKVEIIPYASNIEVCQGSISEINPIVDENGMVRIKASVNGRNKLFDGMKVRVKIKRSVGEQLVVPKAAVVLRSGKQVVFTLDNGKAMWNYVQTGLENMEEYAITEGLQEGMQVITSGNVNLAHEAPVKVIGK